MSGLVDVLQWIGDERFMYGAGTESRAKCDAVYFAVAELIRCSDATVKAFEALGRSSGIVDQLEAQRNCERALIEQKSALARFRGDA